MHVDALARVAALARCQDGVITYAQALECGLSWSAMRYLVTTGRWRRLTRTAYFVDADLYDEPPRGAVLRATMLRHGPEAVLWGASALEVLGIGGIVGWPGRPWVLLPLEQARPPDPDARLRFRSSQPDDIIEVDGFRITAPVRSVADSIPLFDRATGLSILDSALHTEHMCIDDLADLCVVAKGRPGAKKVRELVTLCDGRAASPLESRVRLACIDGDVPPDELQWPVYDRFGILLGYADMAWLRGRQRPLLGEADGEDPHGLPAAVYRDRRRGNDFTGAAVDTVRFTWADTRTPAYIQTTIRKALIADVRAPLNAVI
jgi:hypothetical protein